MCIADHNPKDKTSKHQDLKPVNAQNIYLLNMVSAGINQDNLKLTLAEGLAVTGSIAT